jgi:hypothetical protein
VTSSIWADYRLQADLQRSRIMLLIAGVVLLVASIAGAFYSPDDFFPAYLIGYLFFIGAALGSMAFLMIHHLTGGAWGVVSRRSLEAATRTLPLLAILFIPIGCGMSNLYTWARPNIVRHDRVLLHRSSYTNPAFFLARAAIYIVVWMAFAYLLNRWSLQQDSNPRRPHTRLKTLSVLGLIFCLFSITFAAIDWAESLETTWASSIWGLMFIAAEGLTALCVLILVLAFLSTRRPMSLVLKPDHFHDLGKMLLANLMLWAYFAFVQYLIVWSENLKSEIHYYLPRTRTSWGWLGVALIVAQVVVPLLLLLNRRLKRNAYALAAVAALILIMRYFDLIWIVLPSYYREGFRIQWLDVITPLALAAIWVWAFLRELPRYPLLPVNVPELEEALVHESQ